LIRAALALRPPAPPLSAAAATFSGTRAARTLATSARGGRGSALQDRLTTRGEHRLERLDTVVRRLEEKIIHSGLGLLELADQREGMTTRRHGPAQLRRYPVPARLPQNHELALPRRLDEVFRRPAAAALASPAACRRRCFRLELLRCFHEINKIDIAFCQLAESSWPRRARAAVAGPYKIRPGITLGKGHQRDKLLSDRQSRSIPPVTSATSPG
jgi:hypothetical protein